MYRYGELEALLTDAHGITPGYQATFRHRLKYYRRLGMFGDVKGERNVAYTFKDLLLWTFMIEIAQFGIDPQRMVQISVGIWPMIEPVVLDPANHRDDDLLFIAQPAVLAASILEDLKTFSHRVAGIRSFDKKGFTYTCFRSDLDKYAADSAMLINLTSLYNRTVVATARFAGEK